MRASTAMRRGRFRDTLPMFFVERAALERAAALFAGYCATRLRGADRYA
ncbi:hypothetical protein XHC_1360 [Xanthomonas hortorum pv. carotae str. M081]|nr:hypothetical protein XHC_1360 [Xanthomonas hortorum pv. carotae str. M081]